MLVRLPFFTRIAALALAQLYAPTVHFYDSDLPNAEAVKRKREALAAAPDYKQTLSEIEPAAVDANGGVFVRFEKSTTSRGHAKCRFVHRPADHEGRLVPLLVGSHCTAAVKLDMARDSKATEPPVTLAAIVAVRVSST